MKKRIALFSILIMAMSLTPARAGTLCGTVRDEQTQLPVARAGVFVFLSGSYTGLYAATDTSGVFCVDPIAPGTYDLQVKVNNHETMWEQNVTVQDLSVSVDVDIPSVSVHLALWPNPASAQVNFRFASPAHAPTFLEVYGVGGRLVHAWAGRGSGRETDVSWNLTDPSGHRMAPGVYLVRVRAGSRVSTKKLVLAR